MDGEIPPPSMTFNASNVIAKNARGMVQPFLVNVWIC